MNNLIIDKLDKIAKFSIGKTNNNLYLYIDLWYYKKSYYTVIIYNYYYNNYHILLILSLLL